MEQTLVIYGPHTGSLIAVSSPFEAVILALSSKKRRAEIKSESWFHHVYSSRLNCLGWRLQADPTIIYGVTNGRMVWGEHPPLKLNDASNPYNTYRRDGLPRPHCKH